MPRKVFQPAEVLQAAEVNTFLMDQAVMVFDDATARDAAIPSPIQGMVTFLKDLNVLEAWFGDRWGQVSGAGSITVSETAPTGPDVEDGALWFNSVLGRTFIYYEDDDSAQWVEIGAGSGPTAAAVLTSAPTSAEQGQLWFDSETGNMYFYYVDNDSAQWIQVRSAAPVSSVPDNGYTFVDTVYFTSSGTFEKADYPWLRAIRVKCVGAGGAGAGISATGSGQSGVASGGGGGGYSESFITNIAGLDASVTVTRGAGGSGGVGSGQAPNGTGSAFGSIVTAAAGLGGSGAAGAPPTRRSSAAGASPGVGDLALPGGPSNELVTTTFASFSTVGSKGGDSFMSGGAAGPAAGASAANGISATGFGGGGSGAATFENQSAVNGGNGANGIVIVELFA